MNKTGFTLIELLAVIVILAIIALIATPIVMNVINNAQEGADARSVEAYGKDLESVYYQKLISDPNYNGEGTAIFALTPEIEVSGTEVSCEGATLDATTKEIELTGCTVGSRTQEYTYSSKTGADKVEA